MTTKVYTVEGSEDGLIMGTVSRKRAIDAALDYAMPTLKDSVKARYDFQYKKALDAIRLNGIAFIGSGRAGDQATVTEWQD